jgi:hypothetical protein
VATYLDEDQTGQDTSVIGFPHLLLCQGVVCVMTDGTLVGGHFTTGSTEAALAAKMNALITANGSGIRRMYVAYDSKKKATSAADFRGKAGLFGFHGDVYYFDTSKIQPADGTYVQVTSLGPTNGCIVEYKRNEKMAYTHGPAPPGSLRPTTSGAALATNATTMHKAGHILGLTKITT